MSLSKKLINTKYSYANDKNNKNINIRKSLDDGLNILSEQTKMDLINMGLVKNYNSNKVDRFENTMKDEIVTRSMKLNQEIKSILKKKHLSQCSSPKLISLKKNLVQRKI